MEDAERVRLLGTYRTPRFRIGQRVRLTGDAGTVVYDCIGEDGIDRSVWFISGQEKTMRARWLSR